MDTTNEDPPEGRAAGRPADGPLARREGGPPEAGSIGGSGDRAGGDPGATRERLLLAAAKLFAQRRFEDVSIREIAAAAGVNHGSLNYHFAGKRDLYLEVLQRHAPPGADIKGALHPAFVTGRAARTRAEARSALEGIVRALMARCMHPPSDVAVGMMQHALMGPQGPDDLVFQNVIAPEQAVLRHLMALLAPKVRDERELALMAINVVAQCLVFRFARPVMKRLLEVEDFDPVLAEQAAVRIVATTLRGVEAPSAPPAGRARSAGATPAKSTAKPRATRAAATKRPRR
ncbi:MAG: CerR family C-terminal domain-containing protein [Planctomycetota bacterium]